MFPTSFCSSDQAGYVHLAHKLRLMTALMQQREPDLTQIWAQLILIWWAGSVPDLGQS